MKLSIFLLVLLGWCAVGANPPLKSTSKFPYLTFPKGQVWVKAGKMTEKKKISQDLLLRESALIETGEKSEVYLAFAENMEVLILGESNIEIPSINWENGESSALIIKKGTIIWQQVGGATYRLPIKSELFEFFPAESHFILAFDPTRAWTEMRLLSGQMSFSALNGEESVNLKPGQKASFQGTFEDGEIAFDILLKGKKIPKGHLSKAADMSDLEKKSYSQESLKVLKAKELERRKKAEAKANILLPGQVCRKPNAKFNECSWTCEGNPKSETKKCRADIATVECVRRRCNANGVWAEPTRLDRSEMSLRCGPKPRVADCDY